MALSCARGGSAWILGKNDSQKHWCRAAQGLVGSASLEVLQNCGDVALRDVVMGMVGVG